MNNMSRALRPSAPDLCRIVNNRGHAVTLSSAGYILRPGRSYRLQVIAPFPDEQLNGITIQTPPAFIKSETSTKSFDQEGRSVREIPFATVVPWNSFLKKVICQTDELQINYQFKPGAEFEVLPYRCPIVLKPYLTTIFIAVAALALSLFWTLLQQTVTEAIRGPQLSASNWKWMLQTVLGQDWTLILSIFLGSVLLLTMAYNVARIRSQVRTLRADFRKAYRWDLLNGPNGA